MRARHLLVLAAGLLPTPGAVAPREGVPLDKLLGSPFSMSSVDRVRVNATGHLAYPGPKL